MNQVILFTPVGGTDPISEDNYYEGSMLHICRYYKPDKVILYMSKEMLEKQEQDDRYRYCLNRLAELQNRSMQYEVIERRELTKVHEFDYFYQDFRTIFEHIYEEMDESDTLLLNVSSGTPSMKSGLLVLQTLGEFPAKLIQVATPEEKLGTHTHAKEYDPEMLWELNQDNDASAKNRCKEVECPTLSKMKTEEVIKKHICAYDYRAALDAADTLLEEDNSSYRELLYMAERRLMLDFPEMDKVAAKRNFVCTPIRSSDERKYFEYALNLDIKLRKREYADFVRAISPLIVDLLELILKKQCGVNVGDFCHSIKRNGTYVRQWSAEKLNGTKVGQILESYYASNKKVFRKEEVYSVHLNILLEALSEDSNLKLLVSDLRSVEKSVRNLAAHEIISVTDEIIKKQTGFTSKQIMDMIKEMFVYTGISVRKEYWNSYDKMNEMLLEQI